MQPGAQYRVSASMLGHYFHDECELHLQLAAHASATAAAAKRAGGAAATTAADAVKPAPALAGAAVASSAPEPSAYTAAILRRGLAFEAALVAVLQAAAGAAADAGGARLVLHDATPSNDGTPRFDLARMLRARLTPPR
jgi:hypothetical protein